MTASGHAYRGRIGTEGQWQGWYCELLITTRDVLTGQEQPIEIEGNGEDVAETLEEAARMLRAYGTSLRADFEAGLNVNPPHRRLRSPSNE